MDSLLKEHGLTQADISAKVMRGKELPYAIAKEVFYLDANNRIINLVNYRSKDLEEWTLPDFLASLFESARDWVDLQPNLLDTIKSSNSLDQMTPVEDNNLIPSLVFASIKRHEKPESNSAHNPEAA